MAERPDNRDTRFLLGGAGVAAGPLAQMWRVVRRFLQRPEIILMLIGVILPNLAFLALTLAGFSVPPRTLPLVGYLLVATSLRFLPPLAVILFFLAAVLFDLVFCATQFFGLTLNEAFFAMQFIDELDILNARLYALLLVALAVTIAAVSYLVLREGRRVARASLLPMLLCGVVTVPTDLAVNMPRNSVFWLHLGRDIPFESAMQTSGFEAVVNAPTGRPVLVVIVEALGWLSDPAHRALLDDALAAPALTARYNIASGRNSFLGSTTAGEMRELCGTRTSYLSVRDQDFTDCAAFRLRQAGYETSAYHAFSPGMFERETWWPHIGFEHTFFGPDLYRSGDRLCGDVFIGLCDPDIVAQLGDTLRRNKPQFVYLLTLNTHIPVIVDQGYGHLDCRDGGPIGEREVCIMTDHWIELLQGIATLLEAPDMPLVDVLIVGDHAPPLWHRRARDLFESGQVGWYRLSPK